MALSAEETAAKAAVQSWYGQQYDRVLGRQRAQADTAKLLVTFALAVAATLVATALQVTSSPVSSVLDVAAVLILALGFAMAVNVVFLDDLEEPDPTFAEQQAVAHGWTDIQKLAVLLLIAKQTEARNEISVAKIRAAVTHQLYTSIIAGGLAAISLLIPS